VISVLTGRDDKEENAEALILLRVLSSKKMDADFEIRLLAFTTKDITIVVQ